MYSKQQDKPTAITWWQFSRRGYSAFSSLHHLIRIGVLSAATLGVAVQAEAMQTGNACVIADEMQTDDEEQEMAEVTISGTMAPLTQLQSARIVAVISRQDIEQSAAQSVNDLFKLVTGVDVRQRGGFGIQTDISIDGGGYDQVTLLLNGIDIANPQTGHHTADFPVSIADIERIEVLQGAASRVYGGQSFGGAINIVTKHDATTGADVFAEGGSYGTAEGGLRLALSKRRLSQRISGGGGRSDGGTHNSSWQKGQLYYQGDYDTDALRLDWQFGYSRKQYGANTFYSASYPDQYERNQRVMASVSGETKGRFHFTPQIYWNRAWDNFELIHGERFGENFHITDLYGVKAGGYVNWCAGKTAVAAEMRHEQVLSTSLGRDLDEAQYVPVRGEDGLYYTRSDNRTTMSFSLEHNVILQRWTLSAGLMGSMTSSIDHRFRFYPGIDVAYRPTKYWKIMFSYNKGFRLPTFTELYYKTVTHDGNRDLRPEQNHSVSLAVQHRRQGVEVSVRGFYHRGTQMIDWVMYSPNDVFHTAAFNLDNMGVQMQGRVDFPQLLGHRTWLTAFSAGYTYIHQQKHEAPEVYKSNNALEYLRHKFVASLSHRIVSRLSMSWDLRWQDRMGAYLADGQRVAYGSHATLDAKLQWAAPRYRIHLQANNITDCRYHDIGGVPQPGIWFMAGASIRVGK